MHHRTRQTWIEHVCFWNHQSHIGNVIKKKEEAWKHVLADTYSLSWKKNQIMNDIFTHIKNQFASQDSILLESFNESMRLIIKLMFIYINPKRWFLLYCTCYMTALHRVDIHIAMSIITGDLGEKRGYLSLRMAFFLMDVLKYGFLT